MQGQVLTYDQLTGEGIISGTDGARYPFKGTEWKGVPTQLRGGCKVDFEAAAGGAVAIYAAPGQSGLNDLLGTDEKSHVVAGLLALFLGSIGIHKFYLGYSREGVILLVATVISWVLTVAIIGLFGLMAIGIICLAEAIIYLTKGQDEFTRTYVQGHKSWF